MRKLVADVDVFDPELLEVELLGFMDVELLLFEVTAGAMT